MSSDGPVSLETAVRTRLEATVGLVRYGDLVAHLERDAVFVVDSSISLVDCGVAVAMDALEIVTAWIDEKRLRKPSRAERAAWPDEVDRQWNAIVVQPFVLVQDRAPN